MDNAAMIELRQVTKTFDTGGGRFTALNRVDFRVASGEFVAIFGKSGSGKSTLLNMIAGIDRPTSGEVVVSGTSVHALNESRTAVWRGRTIGIVFQFFQLLPTLNVVENVMLPMDFCSAYPFRERRSRAIGLLERLGLQAHAGKLPSALSGGEQQRVALCRALANDPPVIVADEPTGNLDSRTAEAVMALFSELAKDGKTVIVVTHEKNSIHGLSRRIMIADGTIVSDSDLQSVKE